MNSSLRLVRISRKSVEAAGICSFELVDPQGAPLPSFSAGSHVDVEIGPGLVRQYSLCNDPRETHRYLIAVLRDDGSRGGSKAMHEMQQGQILSISDPRNHFALDAAAPHALLLAGGIGVTPLLCMAERLSCTGASFDFRYCTRSASRAAFAERIRRAAFADRATFHFDDGPPEQRFDAASVIAQQPPGTHLYVCGPTGFMHAMLDAARAAGWPEERLHREFFAAEPVDPAGSAAFEVVLASTGAVVAVAPGQSVVAALSAHGVLVPTSCEQGVCGTCLVRVLDGTPDHRDMYLTPDEQARNDQFTPCCSRALSPRLVLDI